jgi:L-2,4-diaminobutyrate transaminase
MDDAAPTALSLEDMDRQSLFHPFTAIADHERTGPRVMVAGEGCTLTDNQGRRYIDAMAGLWCVNIGYGRPEVAEAIHRQALKLPYYHAFSGMATDSPIELAARLLRMGPAGMSRVFFGNSGSDANDTQVKIVWYYNTVRGKPGKRKIISRLRGYHGVTAIAASMTGLPGLHAGFGLPLPGFVHVGTPHAYHGMGPGEDDAAFVARLAKELDETIVREGPETVGAFIAEPVMGAGGVIVPPPGYYAAIQAVLDRHDVLFIADEVICGFGRLGTMFGCEHQGIRPDLVTIAKGVTSGYVPLSGCLVSEKVWTVLREGSRTLGPFGHGYTYSAHPLAATAAMANLDVIEKDGLVAQAGARGAYMRGRLHAAFDGHPLVGEVRGAGLVAAVELIADRATRTKFDPALKVGPRTARHALDEGLVTRGLPAGDALSFSPPFVITEAEIDEVVARFGRALARTMDELTREGVRIAA